ncbi:hypothetical protein T492DRAFT_1143010 [Pavlovales sp. CCMP2436]|nr:hypothetical protein T492DRAFT_1143010 [Pavlovales sp. CCMP2436]
MQTQHKSANLIRTSRTDCFGAALGTGCSAEARNPPAIAEPGRDNVGDLARGGVREGGNCEAGEEARCQDTRTRCDRTHAHSVTEGKGRWSHKAETGTGDQAAAAPGSSGGRAGVLQVDVRGSGLGGGVRGDCLVQQEEFALKWVEHKSERITFDF